ncbi:MAG: molybdopterin-binding protein [Peptococcaceae bacterium]|jgi:molybdenum cofactor synthesis domain-containing protein|nr:molybdopterin-binding protein [Peptococcaceae bacterium]
MKEIRTQDAVGHVLCHDITQIIKGVTKDAAFRKGHVVKAEDIPALLSLGKENLFVWEKQDGMLHEDEAAEILYEICAGEYMRPSGIKEGKIEVIADRDGLFLVDIGRLSAVNRLGEMMIATRHSGFPVKEGDKLAGTRVIPLVIEAAKMEKARLAGGGSPLLTLRPFREKSAGIVATGSEVFHGRIEDTFTPVIEAKLAEYGAKAREKIKLPDAPEEITSAILSMIQNGADMVFCTGGMSVDPDDRTPLAIKNTGAEIVSYGAPVLPGAMFMLAYHKGRIPIVGLPGCVMYAERTIFDLVLPRLMADVPVTAEWLADLGHGGLCLNCGVCTYPNCGFGKG